MELWIRSQNKEWFGKIDNIEARECSAGMIVRLQDATYSDEYDIYANGDIWVGTYENRERALEILDEIQNIMKPVIMYSPVVKDMTKPEDCYKKVKLESYNSSIEMLDTYVYEMPEE